MSRNNGDTRSRIGITALLAVGVLMGSAGVAMGASALSTATNASAVQYGTSETKPLSNLGPSASGPSQVANARQSAPGPNQVANAGQSPSGTNEALNAAARPATAAAQAPRQLAASQAAELPFTGFAAIPVLLIGLILLASGLVLRRRSSSQTDRS